MRLNPLMEPTWVHIRISPHPRVRQHPYGGLRTVLEMQTLRLTNTYAGYLVRAPVQLGFAWRSRHGNV
jgi:hypothetical protein